MELLTLKTFDSAIDAHLLRSKLASEGIDSFIFDENIMTLNPLYNIMVGGIKLKVAQGNFDAANRVLEEIERTPLTNENDEVITCPSCGSSNLYTGFKSMKGKVGILSMIVTFFLGTYPIYFKSLHRCKDCGTEFKTK